MASSVVLSGAGGAVCGVVQGALGPEEVRTPGKPGACPLAGVRPDQDPAGEASEASLPAWSLPGSCFPRLRFFQPRRFLSGGFRGGAVAAASSSKFSLVSTLPCIDGTVSASMLSRAVQDV